MTVTFLIGNGFDVNLGLNTQYRQFYPYFKEKASKDNMIRNWMEEDIELWADLEEQLGINMDKLSRTEIRKFLLDKSKLEALLNEYLLGEQSKFIINDSKMADEFIRSIKLFDNNISKVRKNDLQDIKRQFISESFLYRFISFNYTDALDKIVKNVVENNPIIGSHNYRGNSLKEKIIGDVLHIHGTLDEGMVLALNDNSQINNEELRSDEFLNNYMIKENLNKRIGERRTEEAIEIIESSKIIIVYGMSLGVTDRLWLQTIIKWVLKDSRNRLIIYIYKHEEKINMKNTTLYLLTEAEEYDTMIDKSCLELSEQDKVKLRERITFKYNMDIFNFNHDVEEDIA